ncbi:tyrosinase family oxidase copper chaperone [Streptomyces sp. NPDC002795]|uniref:tyrosinase family oxidase copper chaperone n=1 Tax=Streptomyces sp. NPDC002795 TaxID=3364665 RepID=UPI0036AACF64
MNIKNILKHQSPVRFSDRMRVRPSRPVEGFLTRRGAGLVLFGSVCSAVAVLRVRPLERDDSEPGPEAFDETHRGRRIAGARLPGSGAAGAGAWQVTVDGRPLHLMRRADGTYLSMVDHYMACPTPLAAAKGAVAELGDQQLRSHGQEM